MTQKSKTIVFFGSGPVAAQSLSLLRANFRIEAVVTKPTTVEQMSQAAGEAPVYAVQNRQELDALIDQTPFSSTVGILIDFGIIVSQRVIDYFDAGIINSHFSLLPEWRGADPITFAILSGQKQTGVSLMLLVEAMDEGPLLAQAPLAIGDSTTTPELTDGLIRLSAQLLAEKVPLYLAGDLTPYPQDTEAQPSYSRKLTKDDGVIDWHKTAPEIERSIRAFITWPRSRTNLGSQQVILTKTHIINSQGTPGEIFLDSKQIGVYCADQAIIIDSLIPSGKKEMSGQAFLAGYKSKLAR